MPSAKLITTTGIGTMKIKPVSLLIVIISLLLVSCSSANAEMVSMYDLQKAMIESDTSLPEMLTANYSDADAETNFSYLSSIDYDKVEGYFLAYASDGTAYEIAVICLKSEADIPLCKASLEAHRDERVRVYQNYKPTEASKAKNADIVSSGRYVALIMSDNIETVKNCFTEFVK